MRELWYYVGITPLQAISTLITTVVIYGVFVFLLNTIGQRIYSAPSNVEVAVAAIIGAVVGRTTLGLIPTLAGGIVALATLMALELTLGAVRRNPRVRSRDRGYRALAIMVNGEFNEVLLNHYNLSKLSIWAALRRAGVRDPQEVALMVLEPNGQFSVLRHGDPIHPDALTGVRNRDLILERLTSR